MLGLQSRLWPASAYLLDADASLMVATKSGLSTPGALRNAMRRALTLRIVARAELTLRTSTRRNQPSARLLPTAALLCDRSPENLPTAL